MRNKIGISIISTVKHLLLIFCIMACFFSCGYYSFSGSTLPSHIKTVAIPTFLDDTPEVGLRERLTNIVVQNFNQDPNLKVVDKKISDSIILGRITQVDDSPFTFDKGERTSQYKFVLTVQVNFEDQKNKKIIWEEQLSTFGVYDAGNRETGINEAIEKISEDIVNKIIAGW